MDVDLIVIFEYDKCNGLNITAISDHFGQQETQIRYCNEHLRQTSITDGFYFF
jgi:hypothetical protein